MSEECVTIRLWRELDEAINSVIDKYTLDDLVEWQIGANGDYVI
jgi:DNA-binding IscR family transcriptional regulator